MFGVSHWKVLNLESYLCLYEPYDKEQKLIFIIMYSIVEMQICLPFVQPDITFGGEIKDKVKNEKCIIPSICWSSDTVD